MVFRQLTTKEKEEFAKNTEAFKKYLQEDEKTKGILDSIMGKNMYHALDTPEKRALWRAGFELKGRCVLFNGEKSESKSWMALGEENITDNDAYYYTLGCCMNKR